MTTLKPKPTMVALTKEEALLFMEFQKRYAFIQMLEELDVFDIRNGSVTINFDAMGAISTVTKNQVFRPGAY